jgi:Type III restriction enzyme, res subunit
MARARASTSIPPPVPREGLFNAELDLFFPRRFDVAGKVLGNPLRRLAFHDHERRCRVAPYGFGRASGFSAIDSLGRTTFITAKQTAVALPTDDVLFADGATSLDAITAALVPGKLRWIHPQPVAAADEELNAAERRCAEIVASWESKFQFRHEHREPRGQTVPGLRLPQIGAVYATLAHWSVSSRPATIVMPTGTGKTETMLALLTCARLPRLMVVVPSNTLRDQISGYYPGCTG